MYQENLALSRGKRGSLGSGEVIQVKRWKKNESERGNSKYTGKDARGQGAQVGILRGDLGEGVRDQVMMSSADILHPLSSW